MRWQPAIRTLPPYHDDPLYIGALKTSIAESLARLDFEPETLIASFHGMPKRTLALGDPYHCHCQKTARLLADALGRPVTIAFQSRFGPAKWLGPATDETLVALGAFDEPDRFRPTYELWTIRREGWLPPFPLDRRYERDRPDDSRTEG